MLNRREENKMKTGFGEGDECQETSGIEKYFY